MVCPQALPLIPKHNFSDTTSEGINAVTGAEKSMAGRTCTDGERRTTRTFMQWSLP